MSFMSLVLMVSLLHVSTALITKHAILTPQIPPPKGSFITTNPHSILTVGGIYYLITVDSQDSYDLKLSFNNSYGFDSLYTSTFSLTMDGITPFIDRNNDILFVFSVGNIQYMSFLLHLDKYNKFNKIYFSSNYTQNVSEWISNNDTINNRYDRISNNNEWITLNKHQSLWPLKFVITNDLRYGCTFEFYHNTSSTPSVQYEIEELVFEPNKDIDIYISGNSINQQFYISSFDILLSKNISTYTPTISPSYKPTLTPTPEPTNKPTFTPTTTPIYIYTINNTNSETNSSKPTEIQLFVNNNNINSTSIIVISIILITVAILCIIVLAFRKCCKPINDRKDSDSFNNENEEHSDSETNSESNNNEYMNEAVLSPTGSNGVSGVKFDGFIVDSRVHTMIMNGIRKFSMNTIMSNGISRKNTNDEIEKNTNDESIHIGNNNEYINDEYINENSLNTIDTRTHTMYSDSTNIIPFHEKQNLEKFIQMIHDKRNNIINEYGNTTNYTEGHKQTMSRKVSDEINCCVSFNYCDEMLE